MQAIRSSYAKSRDFASSVVEFRSAASPTYWMLVNSAFWWCVFYISEEYQLRLLISVSACIFGWDVLLSPSHEHSPLVHLILWPFRETLRSVGAALTLLSAQYLHKAENETACWLAYASLFLFMVNPVLNYQQVPQRVNSFACNAYRTVESVFIVAVVHPVIAVYRIFEYIVLLKWVPVIYYSIEKAFCNFGNWIARLWASIININKNIWNGLVTGICSFCNKCLNAVVSLWHGILNGLWAIYNGIIGGIYFVWRSFIDGILAIWTGFTNGIKSFCRFLRYWFCAHWWPDLKLWLKKNIGEPLERGFNYVCFGLVYVFCFHWLKPLVSFLFEKLAILMGIAKVKLKIFYEYLKRAVLSPLYIWIKLRLSDLMLIAKTMLHELAVMIKDSVLWPICLLFISVLKDIGAYIRATVLQPIYNWFYQKYKFCEDFVLINILAPACKVVISCIPEKSPFCDDSDTELAGFLPEDVQTTGTDSDTESQTAFPRSRSLTPLSDDEHDFAHGLAFPAIDASESSDEFSLETKFRKKTKKVKRRRRSGGKKADLLSDENLEAVATDDTLSQKSYNSERLTPDLDDANIASLQLAEIGQDPGENDRILQKSSNVSLKNEDSSETKQLNDPESAEIPSDPRRNEGVFLDSSKQRRSQEPSPTVPLEAKDQEKRIDTNEEFELLDLT